MKRVFIALSSLALGLGFSAEAAAVPAPSASEFVKPSNHAMVRLSPSGRYFAMARIDTEQKCINTRGQISAKGYDNCKDDEREFRNAYKIVIFDLNEKKPVSVLPMPDNIFVQWLNWANEDRLLAGIKRRTSSNAKGTKITYGGSRIISIPRVEGEYITLFEDSNSMSNENFYLSDMTNPLRSDPQHVIIPAYKQGDLDLWKVNVENGEFERIAIGKPGTFKWHTDNAGKPTLRFDTNMRGTKIEVFSWSDELNDWESIKVFKLKRSDSDEDEYEFYPVANSDTPGLIYVRSYEKDDERRAIKLYDTKKKEFVETVYEHPVYDVGGAIVDYKTGRYAGAWYYADRLEQEFLDKKTGAHYRAIIKFFGGSSNVDFLGFDAAGTKSLLYVTAPDNPGEYYLYDIGTQNISPIMERMENLHGANFGKAETLKINTRDGNAITAYLTSPASLNPNAPLVVMPHGGPESRDYFEYDYWVQFLATRGYRVLQVNFRGSSGYGRTFSEAGYGEWGGVMQDDVTDAVRAVHSMGKGKPASTCIVGASYGAYVALYGAAATPELYRCVVAISGASDLSKSLSETKSFYGGDSETYEYWIKSIGDPGKDGEKLKSKSPINLVDKISAPVLLIHGDEDTIENVNQSRRMNSALKTAGKPVEYLELKHEGHNGWSIETETQVLEKIEVFLSENLN